MSGTSHVKDYERAKRLNQVMQQIIDQYGQAGQQNILNKFQRMSNDRKEIQRLQQNQFFPKGCNYCKTKKPVPVYLKILMNYQYDDRIIGLKQIRSELKISGVPGGRDGRGEEQQNKKEQEENEQNKQNAKENGEEQNQNIQNDIVDEQEKKADKVIQKVINEMFKIRGGQDLFEVVCKQCYDKRNFLSIDQKTEFGIALSTQDEMKRKNIQELYKKLQKVEDKKKKQKLEDKEQQLNFEKVELQLKPMFFVPCYAPLSYKQLRQLRFQMIAFVTGEIFQHQNILQQPLSRTMVHKYCKCAFCLQKWNNHKFNEISESQYKQLEYGIRGIRWISVPKNPAFGYNSQSLCQDCFIEKTSQLSNHGIYNFFLAKLFPEITDYSETQKLSEANKISYDIENKYSQFTLYRASRIYGKEIYQKQLKERAINLQPIIDIFERLQLVSGQKKNEKGEKINLSNQQKALENKKLKNIFKKLGTNEFLATLENFKDLRKYQHLNNFACNTFIRRNQHDRRKQMTEIFIPQGFIMDNLHLRETIRHIDHIAMQHHPNILRVRGFKSQEIKQDDNQDQNFKKISLRIFAQKMITSLDNLLLIKDYSSYKTYLQCFPIFWRMQIALKIFSAVRFMHLLSYNNNDNEYCKRYHCNINPEMIFINEKGETYLCPPLLIYDSDPQKDIQQCGKVFKQLIFGSYDFDSEFELFRSHVNRMMSYKHIKNSSSNITILDDAIEDLKILDHCLYQYMKSKPKIGDFVINSFNFAKQNLNRQQGSNNNSQGNQNNKDSNENFEFEENVSQLDCVYKELHYKLKKEKLFNR